MTPGAMAAGAMAAGAMGGAEMAQPLAGAGGNMGMDTGTGAGVGLGVDDDLGMDPGAAQGAGDNMGTNAGTGEDTAGTDRSLDPAMTDGSDPAANPDDCTRALLAGAVEQYFAGIVAHDPAMLETAPDVRQTENGADVALGEGLWATAEELQFKRSLLDTEQCESLTEAVIENAGEDFILAIRLKLSGGAVSEIEAIAVGPDGFFATPSAIVASADDDWETPLPAPEQPTRAELQALVDDYFELFSGGSVDDYPFDGRCRRAENGFSPGACTFGIPMGLEMTPLHYIIDVEAGTSAGFVLFAGGLLDVHLFKLRDGGVTSVRAVVGPRVRSRGWE